MGSSASFPMAALEGPQKLRCATWNRPQSRIHQQGVSHRRGQECAVLRAQEKGMRPLCEDNCHLGDMPQDMAEVVLGQLERSRQAGGVRVHLD